MPRKKHVGQMIINVANELDAPCPFGLSYVLNMDTLEGSMIASVVRPQLFLMVSPLRYLMDDDAIVGPG